jgi:hypothetical protein
MFSYVELMDCWRKGLRNRNWYHLRVMDRVFYRAATLYARMRSAIINNGIIAQLKIIAEKLKATIKRRIENAGLERRKEIITGFETTGVFKWIPQLRTWLMDAKYVFWLGLNSLFPRNNWTR